MSQVKKTVIVMGCFVVLTYLFHHIYLQYSHGMDSFAMKTMYLTVLVLGVVFYGLLGIVWPTVTKVKFYRGFTNLYNTGLSSVVMGQLIQGVVEIAGTGTPYSTYYYAFGIVMMCAGIGLLIWAYFNSRHYLKNHIESK